MYVITVNGEPQNIPPAQTIAGLLEMLGLDRSRVAVELDRQIIRQAQWATVTLQPGAKLEIVQFVGGG